MNINYSVAYNRVLLVTIYTHVDSLVGSHQPRAVDFVDYRDSNWAMVMHM